MALVSPFPPAITLTAATSTSAGTLPRGTAPLVAALDFVSPDVGWVAFYSPPFSPVGNRCDYDLSRVPVTIARTTDSGRHWTAQLRFTGDSTVFDNGRLWGMEMHFVNGSDGFVYATRDGGRHWSIQYLTLPKRELPRGFISSVGTPLPPSIAGPTTAYLPILVHINRTGAPRTPPPTGTISYVYRYSLARGSLHWVNPRLLPGTDSLTHPMYRQILDARHWWVGSGNTLRRTINAGRSWQTYPLHLPHGLLMTQLVFLDASRGWATATAGFVPGSPACRSILLRTTDAGAHWAPVTVAE